MCWRGVAEGDFGRLEWSNKIVFNWNVK